MDEVVVSGIAKVEHKLRTSRTADGVENGIDVASFIADGGGGS